jgi:hypothetical protein
LINVSGGARNATEGVPYSTGVEGVFAAGPLACASGLFVVGLINGSGGARNATEGVPYSARFAGSDRFFGRGLLEAEGLDEGTDQLVGEVVEVFELDAAGAEFFVPAGQDFVHRFLGPSEFPFGRRRIRDFRLLMELAQGLNGPQVGFQDLDIDRRLLADGFGLGAVGFDVDRGEMARGQVEGGAGPLDDIFQAHPLQVLCEALALQLGGELRVFAGIVRKPVADDLDDLRDAATSEPMDRGDAVVRQAEDFGHAEDFEVALTGHVASAID